MALKKILLVDDVKISLEIEKAALTRSGCEVMTATNGREALELTRKHRPDLVLLDLHMPQMNGDECCRAIKKDPLLRTIPVIMATTAGVETDKDRCIAAGCDDFIFKPFKVPDLLEKVGEHIDITVRTGGREQASGEISYDYQGSRFVGRLQDVSTAGVQIKCSRPLPVGARIGMRFQLPGMAEAVEATGEVVRIVEGGSRLLAAAVQGMGVRFINISAEDSDSITRYTR